MKGNNSDAAEKAFEKLDIKKNLGMDYYQFETHVRAFVVDMVQPMIKKAEEDHIVSEFLRNEYESIKQRLETLSFETNKTLKKSVT
jgi:tRNA U54 and U55 pseudouridine synthase Pus10